MTCVVKVPESVTVRSIGDFRSSLVESLESHEAVELDLDDLVEIDLSFVQLVLAARAHARRKGGSLRLSNPANAPLAALLDRAGFAAEPEPADLDFWFHGELPQ